MSNANSINVFEDIQSLCSDFRRKLKRGERKRIEDYLNSVSDSSKEILFQNLLVIDLEFRRRQKEDPTSDEYAARFPQFRRLIRQAFYESTMMSMEGDAETPAEQETIVVGLPAARRLGEFELLRELGRGGFGVVYAARHLQRHETVALKTLPTGLAGSSPSFDGAERLHKFRHEFRTLSEVNHPNLVGMQTLEVDGDQWYFTMDLVDGVDFLDYVRPNGKLDVQRLRATLTQLVQGILALHERGIVHRDLKPNNVLINADGRVVILDFGLVVELQQQTDQTVSMQSQQFAGTPRYAAPEQAVGTRTTATDWYALGVMLYEALTGKAPFQGSAVQVIVKKQTEDAPTLSGDAEVPQDLAEMVDQLLRRDPAQRPDSAAICQVLGIAVESTSRNSTGSSSATTSSQSEMFLIGRESQLAQLESGRQELLRKREPVVVFISGRSGEGKTSLVEKFLRPLRRDREMLVLSGRCYDRESVPFKAIDSLIDALVAFLRSRGTDEVLRLLPDDIHTLAQLFPVLRRVEAIADRATLNIAGMDGRQIRNLAFAALRDLLSAIGRTTPVVMFIDDLQWGDADSAEVLVKLLAPPDPPAVLLLASFRSDEMDDSPFLRKWNERLADSRDGIRIRDVKVEPLTEAQCLAYLRTRFDQNSQTILSNVAELFENTRGNPYFLEQLVEGYNPEIGHFKPVPLTEIIQNKLRRCPADALELLDVIAVAGKAVSVAEVSAVAGRAAATVGTITHMRSERLLRLTGSQDEQLVDTYHDKIRETVLDQLEDTARRELHRRFAETIEEECLQASAGQARSHREATDRVFDLAHHYLQAGDPRAFGFQLKAGQAALDSYATENALDHLEKAKQIQPEKLDDQTTFQLEFTLAKAQAGCSMLAEAIEGYSLALVLTNTRQERAACYFALGEIHWIRSEFEEGLNSLRQGFAELGEHLPRTLPGKLIAVTSSLASFHLTPAGASVRFKRKSAAELSMLSKMYALSHWLVIQLDIALALFFAARSCVVSKHVKDARVKAEAYASYASLLAFVGSSWLAKPIMARMKKHAAALPDDEKRGKIDSDVGLCMYSFGRLQEAEEALNQAAERLGRSGHYQQTYPQHFLWHLWSIRGRPSRMLRHARNEEAVATRSNDRVLLAYSWYGQAEGLARQGKISEALRLADESLSTLESVKGSFICVANIQKARVHLQAGNYADARLALRRALQDIPKLRFNELTAPTFSLLVEAILADNWVRRPNPITPRDRRRAGWAALAGRLCGYLFPNHRPLAFRVTGRLAAAKGKTNKAMAYFDKAIAASEKIGAESERARSLIDKSLLDHPDAPADRSRGLAILEELGCVLPDAELEYLDLPRTTQPSAFES